MQEELNLKEKKDDGGFTVLIKTIYEIYSKGEITKQKLENNTSKILETK